MARARSRRCPTCLTNWPLAVGEVCPSCDEPMRPWVMPPDYPEPPPPPALEKSVQQRIEERRARKQRKFAIEQDVEAFRLQLDLWDGTMP